MSDLNLKKFSIYEFSLNVGENLYEVVYKKDDENNENSVIKINDGNRTIDVPVDLFMALHETLNEIDPYGFVFSNLDNEEG